jgi:phosphate transport system substrate-binding protein
MKNNQQINSPTLIKCTHCGYEKNPATSVTCLKCGWPLDTSAKPNSNRVAKPQVQHWEDKVFILIIWLSFGLGLLFLSWLGYYMFVPGKNLGQLDYKTIENSSESTLNLYEGIKLYDNLKDVQNVPEGMFNYGGAVVFASLTANGLNEAIAKAHPNFRIRYTEPRDGKPGGKKGVAMLFDGELSIVHRAGPLTDADYIKAQQRGFEIKQVPVGYDAIVFFTHRDISIPGLSINQLKDIYKGKITNWKLVGGPDLPIVPFSRSHKDSILLTQLLGDDVDQVSSRVQFTRDYTDTMRRTGSTPGGISFLGNAPVLGQKTIRSLAIAKDNSQEYVQPLSEDGLAMNATVIRDGSYPMTRRLFVVFRADGTIDELAGEAYANLLLTKEAQQIFEKAGFVPVR